MEVKERKPKVGGPLTGREGRGGLLAQFQAPELPEGFYNEVRGLSSLLLSKDLEEANLTLSIQAFNSSLQRQWHGHSPLTNMELAQNAFHKHGSGASLSAVNPAASKRRETQIWKRTLVRAGVNVEVEQVAGRTRSK